MIGYTYIHGANFPANGFINNVQYKDVTDDIAALINQIKEAQAEGNYSRANTLISTNNDILENYIIDAEVINRLIEEQRNTQIYAMQQSQSIYFTEPINPIINDVWIRES